MCGLKIHYDDNGGRVGLQYNGANYLYVYNAQGDVVAIVDSNHNLVVSYSYDEWGNKVSVTGGVASTLGVQNPFRYRGYCYDEETGWYYLQSRYYDPVVGRFLNIDVAAGVNGDTATYNLFVYCGNNPVDRYDVGGMFWKELWEGVKCVVSSTFHIGNTILICSGIDTAVIGASVLDMQKDNSGVYHANFDCWQQYFGYSDLYDIAFDIGTDMQPAKFPFSCNGTQYMIWAWKGDYINLGAGAELGIYYGGGPLWLADTSLAMSMCMGLMYEGTNIISYYPSGKQWWITGFNPAYQNKKASQLTAVFGINFNTQAMYDAFYGAYKNDPRIFAFISSERGVIIIF